MNHPLRELVGIVDGRMRWDRPAFLFAAFLVQELARGFVDAAYWMLVDPNAPDWVWSTLSTEIGSAGALAESLWSAAALTCTAVVVFRWIRSAAIAIPVLAIGYVLITLPIAHLLVLGAGDLERLFYAYWQVPSLVFEFSYIFFLFGGLALALRLLPNSRWAVVVGAATGGLLLGIVLSLYVGAIVPGERSPSEFLQYPFVSAGTNSLFALVLILGGVEGEYLPPGVQHMMTGPSAES